MDEYQPDHSTAPPGQATPNFLFINVLWHQFQFTILLASIFQKDPGFHSLLSIIILYSQYAFFAYILVS